MNQIIGMSSDTTGNIISVYRIIQQSANGKYAVYHHDFELGQIIQDKDGLSLKEALKSLEIMNCEREKNGNRAK